MRKQADTDDEVKCLGVVSSASNSNVPSFDLAIAKLQDQIANLQKAAEAEGASKTPTTAVATATATTEAALDSSVSNPTTPKAGNGKDDSEQETEGN